MIDTIIIYISFCSYECIVLHVLRICGHTHMLLIRDETVGGLETNIIKKIKTHNSINSHISYAFTMYDTYTDIHFGDTLCKCRNCSTTHIKKHNKKHNNA